MEVVSYFLTSLGDVERIYIQDNHFQLNGEFPFKGGRGDLEINDKSFLF